VRRAIRKVDVVISHKWVFLLMLERSGDRLGPVVVDNDLARKYTRPGLDASDPVVYLIVRSRVFELKKDGRVSSDCLCGVGYLSSECLGSLADAGIYFFLRKSQTEP
jgi:hypothetical protein